eukprot:CAMPEP_0201198798 /NCGR_PEP_ID=MMETSP0851-20130426/157540_1 /ASSEMBLY_ACC=CAM_ASM_000631 /TAXON_ID=183588 /ORGANISM="Pseudo-nitzschia fraudulenta, Strain WWA7" /LENGTH=32 /DNA_ID= /DNA_START= /DNA_END= /DNA_ORIENTATION=
MLVDEDVSSTQNRQSELGVDATLDAEMRTADA